LLVQILFNISIILQELLVNFSIVLCKLLLLLKHHLLELVLEFDVRFIESNLDPLLKSGIIYSHLVFQILQLLGEGSLHDFEFLAH